VLLLIALDLLLLLCVLLLVALDLLLLLRVLLLVTLDLLLLLLVLWLCVLWLALLLRVLRFGPALLVSALLLFVPLFVALLLMLRKGGRRYSEKQCEDNRGGDSNCFHSL
jgi:hypothetical protein